MWCKVEECYALQGRARGNKPALWVRSKLQEELFQLGRLIQRHAGKVLFTGVLLLASLTIGLKSVILEVRGDKHYAQLRQGFLSEGFYFLQGQKVPFK
jgi:hypothetical protein